MLSTVTASGRARRGLAGAVVRHAPHGVGAVGDRPRVPDEDPSELRIRRAAEQCVVEQRRPVPRNSTVERPTSSDAVASRSAFPLTCAPAFGNTILVCGAALTTFTGIVASVVPAFPSCPRPSRPQHLATPPVSHAQECWSPTETAIASTMPATTTGADALVVVPFPRSPNRFSPQQSTVPLTSSAHECAGPRAEVDDTGQAANDDRQRRRDRRRVCPTGPTGSRPNTRPTGRCEPHRCVHRRH